MKRFVRIEGVQVDLDYLKSQNHTDETLKKTDTFPHLPEGQQAAAYKALQAELDAHAAAPATVTVEKGKSVKTVAAEETQAAKEPEARAKGGK